MNPFVDIVKVDENRNLEDSRLIIVGSKCGEGKTIAIHTMILNYILSGINVILFSETQERSTRMLFNHLDSLNLDKKTIGQFVTLPLIFEDTIEGFNRAVAHNLEFMIGATVLIIDGPMFEMQSDSFSYKKFKNENTRFVIVEKYNRKSRLDTTRKEEENPYTKKKIIAETLRSLATHFNTHIIISTQHRNTSHDLESSDASMIYASDVYVTTKKHPEKEGVFIIMRYKDRFSPNLGVVNCAYDKNNLTFATIKD
jgi:hypothetical protein